jgi:hypothetical protein
MNGAELSWFDKLKIFITPKSHAEETVDFIYGPEGRGLIPIPETYYPERALEPQIYAGPAIAVEETVAAVRGAVSGAVKGAENSFIKLGIIAFVAVAALVAINAFVRR